MLMYDLIEHGDNYSKICGSLWQYYRGEPALTDAGDIDTFLGNSVLFNFQEKISRKTGNNGK